MDHIENLTAKFILSYPSRNSRSENPLFLQKQEGRKKGQGISFNNLHRENKNIQGFLQLLVSRRSSKYHFEMPQPFPFQPGLFPFPPANITSKFLISAWQKSNKKNSCPDFYLLLGAEGEKFMLRQNLTLFNIKNQHYCA